MPIRFFLHILKSVDRRVSVTVDFWLAAPQEACIILYQVKFVKTAGLLSWLKNYGIIRHKVHKIIKNLNMCSVAEAIDWLCKIFLALSKNL